jgi:hypothetical protein
MTTNWQQLRSELNHDWLKNVYLRQLQAFVIRSRSSRPDRGRMREFLQADFYAWRARRPSIVALLDDAERALSPATLFDEAPLSACAELDQAWLRIIIHELWLVRRPVREWCESGRRALEVVDVRFEEASKGIGCVCDLDLEQLGGRLGAFEALSEAILALIHRISAFPHEIEVV